MDLDRFPSMPERRTDVPPSCFPTLSVRVYTMDLYQIDMIA